MLEKLYVKIVVRKMKALQNSVQIVGMQLHKKNSALAVVQNLKAMPNSVLTVDKNNNKK